MLNQVKGAIASQVQHVCACPAAVLQARAFPSSSTSLFLHLIVILAIPLIFPFSTLWPSLSSPRIIPPLLQGRPAAPLSVYHSCPCLPSLQYHQHLEPSPQRNVFNYTLLHLTPSRVLLLPSPCTPHRSRPPSLLLSYLPGELSHQPRQPFSPFLPLHTPLFVVAPTQDLLLQSFQAHAPRLRRGVYLCPHVPRVLLTPRRHHPRFESIAVVLLWRVQREGSFTLKTTQSLMTEMTLLPDRTASTLLLWRTSPFASGVT